MRVLFATLGVIFIWQLEIITCNKMVPVRQSLNITREYKQCISKVDCPKARVGSPEYFDYRHFWCCQGTCSLEICEKCSTDRDCHSYNGDWTNDNFYCCEGGCSKKKCRDFDHIPDHCVKDADCVPGGDYFDKYGFDTVHRCCGGQCKFETCVDEWIFSGTVFGLGLPLAAIVIIVTIIAVSCVKVKKMRYQQCSCAKIPADPADTATGQLVGGVGSVMVPPSAFDYKELKSEEAINI